MGDKILLIGSGGREHALAWKIAQSPRVGQIYAIPGNPGMEDLGVECIPSIKTNEIEELADFAYIGGIDLTVVGPEDPLALGIVDNFTERELPVFGPSKSAAQIESDKSLAKHVMNVGSVPTATYTSAEEPGYAKEYIEKFWRNGKKFVVKATGLALGKGVYVCDTKEQAFDAIDALMVRKEHGKAGEKIIIEERLFGPEVSFIALVDQFSDPVFFPEAQDYKPVFDGDKGLNTGGMGSYSPVPAVSPDHRQAMKHAMRSTTLAMKTLGIPYNGALYGGFMLTEEGPKVLEFNARFGDPETQPLMMRLRSDVLPYLQASADHRPLGYNLGTLPQFEIDNRAAVCVVLASGGYPGKYEKGKLITGLDDVKTEFDDNVMVFQAGTKKGDDGRIYTNGGRVLGVTALGKDLDQASDLAYMAAGMIRFEGKYFRKDIGRDVLARGRAV